MVQLIDSTQTDGDDLGQGKEGGGQKHHDGRHDRLGKATENRSTPRGVRAG